MLKIFSFNLLIISFLLISCSKSDDDSTSSTATYPTSASGVTASGTMSGVSGTYAQYALMRLV